MKTAVRWGSATHQGRVRGHNEDAVLAGPQVFAVADGMGGYAGGEIASALTVTMLASTVGDQPTPLSVRSALTQSNTAIVERGLAQGTPGMGSTVAGIAPIGDHRMVVFSLGDSRVYRHRGATLEQLTDDDSVVAELVRNGTLTDAEARERPDRNVITKALGVDNDIDPQVFELETEAGDVFVIASDGLFNEVTDDMIAAVASEPGSEDRRARKLMDLALDNGGRDNISVVVVTVTDADQVEDLAQDTNPSPSVGTYAAEPNLEGPSIDTASLSSPGTDPGLPAADDTAPPEPEGPVPPTAAAPLMITSVPLGDPDDAEAPPVPPVPSMIDSVPVTRRRDGDVQPESDEQSEPPE